MNISDKVEKQIRQIKKYIMNSFYGSRAEGISKNKEQKEAKDLFDLSAIHESTMYDLGEPMTTTGQLMYSDNTKSACDYCPESVCVKCSSPCENYCEKNFQLTIYKGYNFVNDSVRVLDMLFGLSFESYLMFDKIQDQLIIKLNYKTNNNNCWCGSCGNTVNIEFKAKIDQQDLYSELMKCLLSCSPINPDDEDTIVSIRESRKLAKILIPLIPIILTMIKVVDLQNTDELYPKMIKIGYEEDSLGIKKGIDFVGYGYYENMTTNEFLRHIENSFSQKEQLYYRLGLRGIKKISNVYRHFTSKKKYLIPVFDFDSEYPDRASGEYHIVFNSGYGFTENCGKIPSNRFKKITNLPLRDYVRRKKEKKNYQINNKFLINNKQTKGVRLNKRKLGKPKL